MNSASIIVRSCFLILLHITSAILRNYNKIEGRTIQNSFSPPGGLEPPTFRLTAERASRLRHGGLMHVKRRIIWSYYSVLFSFVFCTEGFFWNITKPKFKMTILACLPVEVKPWEIGIINCLKFELDVGSLLLVNQQEVL